ncbi:hypothetical protein BESB_002390 [Besnoitia besnoiti]|uniref:Rab3-GAP regulatory subunit N-terminal domain-containing protein n=1 Tax=Besnoitia besnoiti TaxID=94643 RepID=A0A2A9MH88_BESBE|nr:hypothetical protein BESB_002390 [Besnoitia besnoiti]PFH37898.1 hypothetical protein BESB_002390 [Besnoitia besnoiti]
MPGVLVLFSVAFPFFSGSVCIYSASGSLCLAFGWMDTPPLRAVAFLDPLESAAISTSGAFSASPFVWTRAPGASPSFTTPAISAATPLFSSRGADAEDAREMSANEMNGESPGSLQETPPACVGFLFAAPVSSASPPNVESLVGIASLAALRRALFAPESVSAGGGGGAGRDDCGKRLLEPADASEGPRVRRGGEEERADASRAVERVLLKLNRGTTHAIALVPRSCASGAAALSMHLDSDDAIIFAPELLTDLADASSLAACAPSASQFLFGDRAASSSCMMSPAAPSLSLRQTRRGAAAARERLAAAAADSAPSSSPLATAATGGVPAAPLAASPASSVASALLEVGVLAAGRDAVLTLHVYPAAALSAEAARVGARVTRRGETRTLALRTLRPTRLLSAAASYVSHGLSSLLGSPAHAAEETPAPASSPVPGSRTENGKPRAEGADGVDSVGAVNLPSLAGQVLDERRRTGLSLAVCPWNAKLAAITDNCGRVSLVHTSSLEILHMWKGYREAQVAWLRRGRASSPARPSQAPEGGLVFYAPRRNSVELWSTPSLAFTPHSPRRVGLLFTDPPGAAAPLRLVANGGRVLLVDAEGRVAALGWPSPPEALGATLAGLFEVSR